MQFIPPKQRHHQQQYNAHEFSHRRKRRLANSTAMSQWTSINSGMPKAVPEPQSDNTRATGLRNFLKGEVITVNSDSDDDECMGNPEEIVSQVPEGVHPSRIKNHVSRKGDSDPTWREPKKEQVPADWTPTGNNNIPLTVNASKNSMTPRYALTSYATGSNCSMLGLEANDPPKAPKAMISSPRKGRFDPIQGVKQPPTGPKAGAAPQKPGAEGRNRSISRVTGTPRRKKYIAARKLISRKKDAASAVNNGWLPSATRSAPPRADKEKDSSQPLSSQLKKNSRNASDNLTPSAGHDPNHPAARPEYALFRDSVTPNKDIAPWDKYVEVPRVPSSRVAGATDSSLEQGHQVHPTRLNHLDPHYNTVFSGPDRYLSPPTKPSRNDLYKDGDIVGAGASQIAATSKGRRMLEKMGYKPGISLGKSGKEEAELAVVMMKIGRGGLGAGPGGRLSEGTGVLATPSSLPRRNISAWVVNATSSEQDENRSRLESSGYQETFEAKGVKAKSESPSTIAQKNSHNVVDNLSGEGTKERVVIIIDSDDDEGEGGDKEAGQEEEEQQQQEEEEEKEEKQEYVQEVLLQEKQQEEQGQQKDQKMDDPEVIDESEAEYNPEDMEMGDQHDYVVHPLCHDPHFVQAEPTPTRLLYQESGAEGATCLDTEGQPVEDVVDMSFNCDATVSRWQLPPFRYSSSSCKPTVPMQLLGLIIIERLEQIALVEIFHCISAFEEDSYRLTDPAFNHVLVKSFLRARDMFMRDPLLNVDQEICEGIVKEEFGTLLERLAAKQCLEVEGGEQE